LIHKNNNIIYNFGQLVKLSGVNGICQNASQLARNHSNGIHKISYAAVMTFLYIVIALVIIFDFINGFHDSANSIAAVVSTKVLSPIAAVSMAAFLNFISLEVAVAELAQNVNGNPICDGVCMDSSQVKWGVLAKIFRFWIFTIPVSALIGGVMYFVFRAFFQEL